MFETLLIGLQPYLLKSRKGFINCLRNMRTYDGKESLPTIIKSCSGEWVGADASHIQCNSVSRSKNYPNRKVLKGGTARGRAVIPL